MDLARTVMTHAQNDQPFTPLYALDIPVRDKILTVARRMYGADRVTFTTQAERDLADIDRLGHAGLPVCIAKTPASLSDDPSRRASR